MNRRIHNFDFLGKVGPYSHIVDANGFLFASGMIAIDPDNGLVITDDIKRGSEVVLNNIRRALEQLGSGMDKVVKATVYLGSMADFNTMNEVYKMFFPTNPPARTCVAVNGIPGNSPIEIEVVALK